MHGRGICAARDRTGDTAAFRTNGHCFLLPQHLRAAKWHFYPDTTRPRTVRFKNQNPARGRKLDRITISAHCFVISKPYPRKGTETGGSRGRRKYPYQFQNHIPARGRKRSSTWGVDSIRNQNFKTISPQGDGNYCPTKQQSLLLRENFKTISPQGDGNLEKDEDGEIGTEEISKPYPRKGTETACELPCSGLCFRNFKTISPQGDGNSVQCSRAVAILISKPYPRKGTETLRDLSLTALESIFQNHIPARGRKQ